MLISKACAYSQVALVLEVLVQDGPSAVIDEGRLYLKGAQQQVSSVYLNAIYLLCQL